MRAILALILPVVLAGCLRPALQADAPRPPAPAPPVESPALVVQDEALDPLQLPERPAPPHPGVRRLGTRPAPSSSPAERTQVDPPLMEPSLVSKVLFRHTDPLAGRARTLEADTSRASSTAGAGDSRRRPFFRPAKEAVSGAATAAVAAVPAPAETPAARPSGPRDQETEPVGVVGEEAEWMLPATGSVVDPGADDADQALDLEERATGDGSPDARGGIPPDARFQIQIMSTSDPEQAEDMRLQALLVFPDEHVDVVWDPPNYKVRVGAMVTMEAAGEMKRRALRLGFNNAWVVPRRMP